MSNKKLFTVNEVPEDDFSIEEISDVLQGMIAKGLVEIVGLDKEGNNLYQLTELGRNIMFHLDSDKSEQN